MHLKPKCQAHDQCTKLNNAFPALSLPIFFSFSHSLWPQLVKINLMPKWHLQPVSFGCFIECAAINACFKWKRFISQVKPCWSQTIATSIFCRHLSLSRTHTHARQGHRIWVAVCMGDGHGQDMDMHMAVGLLSLRARQQTHLLN